MGSFFTAERTYTHRRVHTQKAGLYMHPGPAEAPVHRIEIAIGKALQVGVGGMLGWSAWLVAGGLPYVACD